MRACITESGSSHPVGCNSCGSSYPESERAYFQRVYGSDHLKQLYDDHQEASLLRYAKPWRVSELETILRRNSQLACENDSGMTKPGRSAYSLQLLRDNLHQYTREQWRSLRWNQHYRKALAEVAKDVGDLLKGGQLQPMSIERVATSEPVTRNLDKNAGYMCFETGQRSKGENLEEAVKWVNQEMLNIALNGDYGLPCVISHRSSNSKPTGTGTWKWRCRIILMQDLRALLLDGRFAVPVIQLFINCPWGEGGMTQQEVRNWVAINRCYYDRFYSSDYSKFDVSQPAWLLEDVFDYVIRPLFGELSDLDEKLFSAMKHSYIHKEIHSFDGILHVHGCQLSGSLTTYAYNTIINQIIDWTVLYMQGCDPRKFKSLKCGDDNLTFYRGTERWDKDEHCKLIYKYFGINTTIGERDTGDLRFQDPTFLSKTWTYNGEERDINEVIWNLTYPERYRNYDPEVSGISVERAEALVLLSSCLEQEATMREYIDFDRLYAAAQIRRGDIMSTYMALAKAGTGFKTAWLNYKFGNLSIRAA